VSNHATGLCHLFTAVSALFPLFVLCCRHDHIVTFDCPPGAERRRIATGAAMRWLFMKSDLCVGIASKDSGIALATDRSGDGCVEINFPSTPMGVQAVRIALADYEQPVRLAVAGSDALALALAVGRELPGETFVVARRVADQPADLVRFARRTN